MLSRCCSTNKPSEAEVFRGNELLGNFDFQSRRHEGID